MAKSKSGKSGGSSSTHLSITKGQKDLLNSYTGEAGYGSEGAGKSLQEMLTTGRPTQGFNPQDIAAMQTANTAMAKTNLADMLGQTRGAAAKGGTFFSTAARGKEADQARRASEALTQQNTALGLDASKFKAGLDEAAAARIASMLGTGANVATGNTTNTVVNPNSPPGILNRDYWMS
jgi:hypothetical protein